MNMECLNGFLNKKVVIVYKEAGEVKHLKGFLRGIDDNFVLFETDFNKIAVAINDIIKLKSARNGGDND